MEQQAESCRAACPASPAVFCLSGPAGRTSRHTGYRDTLNPSPPTTSTSSIYPVTSTGRSSLRGPVQEEVWREPGRPRPVEELSLSLPGPVSSVLVAIWCRETDDRSGMLVSLQSSTCCLTASLHRVMVVEFCLYLLRFETIPNIKLREI